MKQLKSRAAKAAFTDGFYRNPECMKATGRTLFWLAAFLIAPTLVWAQGPSLYQGSGLPFFYQHFGPQDYLAYPQNWGVAQAPNGLLYVANYDGVLEYDGKTWRLIPTANKSVVRSVAVDDDGTVYVGAIGDFGFLAPDSSGSLHYVSLLEHIATPDLEFSDVWGTHATEDGIYFQTGNRLYRWNGKQISVWHSERGFHTSYSVRDRLYVREKGVGLLTVKGDALRQIPGGDRMAEARVFSMLPYGQDQLLVATRDQGFFIYDGETFRPFATGADAYLAQHRLYHGTVLPGGFYAFATLDGGGVVLIDREGHLVQVHSPASGLPDGWVNYVFADHQGGLWMALHNKGLVRVDGPSAVTRFDRTLGLEGNIYRIQRHEGVLYAATGAGLYRLIEPRSGVWNGRPLQFEQVGTLPPSNALLSTPSGLLMATGDALFLVHGSTADRLFDGAFFSLVQSARARNRIYVGMKTGLAVLEHTTSGWRLERRVGGIQEEIFSMTEEPDGTLWATTRDRQLLRVQFRTGGRVQVERFAPSALQVEGDLVAAIWKGRAVFLTRKGIFRYVASSEAGVGRFERETSLLDYTDDEWETLLAMHTDEQGRAWLARERGIDIVDPRERSAARHLAPWVLSFPRWTMPVRILVEENGVAWLGNGATLLRYDARQMVTSPYDAPVHALVRRVTTIEKERVIFGGTTRVGERPVLPFDENALSVEYAVPSFNDPEATQYQLFLEGRDAGWSDWTSETIKRYTNLREGVYHLRVRARNGQGVVSTEGRLTFEILPPWYRTLWAYGFYLLLVGALLVFGLRYRRMVQEHRLAREQAQELARERVLNERLQQANVRLQEANDRLVQVDRLKDEFLANTSHELRTPLTAILGFSSILKEETSEEHREFVGFIEENGQRLLRTLDSLLDLARLRAGTLEVEYERLDVSATVAHVASSFTQQALRKGLDLKINHPAEPVQAWLDVRCFDGVIHHLVGNAVKFTESGSIHLTVGARKGQVVIEVRDTGIGIDEAFIPYLFDEFKQESTGLSRTYEGNGLGLAVTYRLIKLMRGDIAVQSRKGEGSVFTISFPLAAPEAEPRHPVIGDGLPAAVRFVN